MLISGNFSDFAVTMVIGTIFGWIGDYFLHAKPSNAYFATGFVSFLIGHIAYIIAFVRATPVISADYDMFNLTEVLILIGIVAAAMVISRVLKVKFAPRIVELAIWIYVITITIMLVRASALGMCYWTTGGENGLIAFLVLTLGAVFFLMSDVTLGLIIFGGQKKNYPLKIFNILTYFWGQVMLASSILFINA